MNHCGTQRLETNRLLLRRLTEADAEAMYRNWASDPEVTRFMTWPMHTDVNVTKYVIGTWLPLYEKDDYYHWAISVTMNTYTHLGLDDACEELHRMGEIERAQAEQERVDGETPDEGSIMAI